MKTISKQEAKRFWKKNIKLIAALLAVWFTASYLIVILLGDVLSGVKFLGTTLPFWFGQQGAIIIFLGLLMLYAGAMNRITASIKETESAAEEVWSKAAETVPDRIGEEVLV